MANEFPDRGVRHHFERLKWVETRYSAVLSGRCVLAPKLAINQPLPSFRRAGLARLSIVSRDKNCFFGVCS